MTARKPWEVPFEDWVDRQVREPQERGAFDDLPGAGKPIPELDKPWDPERWASDWVKREGGDLTAALPPALQLRRERERLLAALPAVASEPAVRDRVDDFNTQVRELYRRPMTGPLIAVGLLDVEDTVARWRSVRPPEPGAAEPPTTASGSRWPWWARRARRRDRA